jgi:hypothetical protein
VLAADRRALRPNDRQHVKMPAVPRQPRQDSSPEKRRFPGPRGSQNRRKPRRRRVAQSAQRIQREDDCPVAPEEDPRIVLIQRQKSPIRRPAEVVRRWPEEGGGIQARLLEAGAETGEAGTREIHNGFRLVTRRGERRRPAGVRRAEVNQLPFRSQLDRQIAQRRLADDDAEDLLVHLLGQQELGEAPARFGPVGADQDEDQFALFGRRLERRLPAVARDEAALRIEVKKNVAPALFGQPIVDRQRFRVVRRRMRNKNLAQDRTQNPSARATLARKGRRENGPGAAN